MRSLLSHALCDATTLGLPVFFWFFITWAFCHVENRLVNVCPETSFKSLSSSTSVLHFTVNTQPSDELPLWRHKSRGSDSPLLKSREISRIINYLHQLINGLINEDILIFYHKKWYALLLVTFSSIFYWIKNFNMSPLKKELSDVDKCKVIRLFICRFIVK